jgi:hypothetical protein
VVFTATSQAFQAACGSLDDEHSREFAKGCLHKIVKIFTEINTRSGRMMNPVR